MYKNDEGRFYLIIFYSLSLITVILYLLSMNYPYIYDDNESILRNLKLHNINNIKDVIFSGLRQIRVWQNLSFSVDWAISGPKPWSMRISSLILHSLNTLLIYKLLGRLGYQDKKRIFLIGLFFCSPLQIQSVHYVMGRTTLIISFFYLLIIYKFIEEKRRTLSICFLMLLSLLAKEIAVMIPIIFYYINNTNIISDKITKFEMAAYWLICSLYIPLYNILKDPVSMYEGVVGFNIFPVGRYLITQGYFVIKYISMLFLPYSQSIIHEMPLMTNKVLLMGMVGWLLILLLIFYSIKIRKNDQIFIILLVIAAITIIPTNTFLQVINPLAEYRMYLVNLFIFYILVEIIFYVFTKFNIRKYIKVFFLFLSLYFLIFLKLNLSIFSTRGLAMTYALELYPNYPQLNLIHAQLLDDQKGSEAKFYYEKAYQLYKVDPHPKRIHYVFNLARFWFNKGNYEETIRILNEGKSFIDENDSSFNAYKNLLEHSTINKLHDEKNIK